MKKSIDKHIIEFLKSMGQIEGKGRKYVMYRINVE